jgi:mercuric ion transport protein
MNTERRSGSGFLALGGITAVLASSCCLGPLILVMLGFSGSWIGNLSVLEPYRPLFLGFTMIALLVAAVYIFRRPQACEPHEICSHPKSRKVQKIVFSVIALLALVGFAFPYFAHYLY